MFLVIILSLVKVISTLKVWYIVGLGLWKVRIPVGARNIFLGWGVVFHWSVIKISKAHLSFSVDYKEAYCVENYQ